MTTSPAQSYQSALNYTINDASARVETNAANFKKFLTKFNNSTYMYPTISIIIFTITNLIILFCRNINKVFKFLSIVILLIYIFFTIYWFKK